MAWGGQLASWEAQGPVVGGGRRLHPSWAGGMRRPLQQRTVGKGGFGRKIISGKALPLFLQGSGKHTEKCKLPLLCLMLLDSRKYNSMLYVPPFDICGRWELYCAPWCLGRRVHRWGVNVPPATFITEHSREHISPGSLSMFVQILNLYTALTIPRGTAALMRGSSLTPEGHSFLSDSTVPAQQAHAACLSIRSCLFKIHPVWWWPRPYRWRTFPCLLPPPTNTRSSR